MKKITLILFALMIATFTITGQTKLSDSRVTSEKNYIYKLDIKQLRDLFLSRESVNSEHLTTFVAAYGDKQPIPYLERGNYMIVRAVSGQLESVPHTVDDLFYNFIDTKKGEIMVADRWGVAIKGCRIVAFKVDEDKTAGASKRFNYDSKKGVYGGKIFNEPKKGRSIDWIELQSKAYVEIENSGVYHYVELDNPYAPYVLRGRGGRNYDMMDSYKMPPIRGREASENGYKYSTVLVNKPKYRPEETVKLKAILMDRKGKPIKGSVDLFVEQNGEEKRIAQLEPFRAGAYSYEFLLKDKELEFLRLNNYIGLNLKNPKDSTLYASGHFMYEDYELLRSSFTTRIDKSSYVFGDTVKLYVKATDDNGLAEIGGRVDVEIRANANVYSTQLRRGYTFIPEVVWQERVYIDKMGEKEIVVPDSVIQKNVDKLDYSVSFSYLSVDNESKEAWDNFMVTSEKIDATGIDYKITEQGLRLAVKKGDEELTRRAMVKAVRMNEKVIDSMEVDLPATITPMWSAYKYVVEASSEWPELEIYMESMVSSMLNVEFIREGAEVVLKVDNPNGFEFVYDMVGRNGKKIEAKGNSREKKFERRVKNSRDLALVLQYIVGEKSYTKKGQVYALNREVKIGVDAPLTAYPGEKIDIELEVLDGKKRPIYGADIAAFGVTSKFGVGVTDGYVYADQPSTERFLPPGSRDLTIEMLNKLEWDRWREEMALGEVEYYKFAFPNEIYTYAEPARDGITQVAPFVVIDGVVQQAEVVYIDEVPHYYSGAEQVQPYSFAVHSGVRTIWMVINSSYVQFTCDVKAGMKNIVSVDGAKSSDQVVVKKRKKRGELLHDEREFIRQYMIDVNGAYDTRGRRDGAGSVMGMLFDIESDERLYVPYKERYSLYRTRNFLLGPFPYKRDAHYNLEGERLYDFNLLGGYSYNFLYKQPLVLTSFAENRIPATINVPQREINFKEQILSRADADSIELSIRNIVLREQIGRIVVTEGEEGEDGKRIKGRIKASSRWTGTELSLVLGALKGETESMKPLYIVVYKDGGKERYFYNGSQTTIYLDQGEYEVELVMENATSHREAVRIAPDGYNFLSVDQIETTPMARDMNREIGSIILRRNKRVQKAESNLKMEDVGKLVEENQGSITGVIRGYKQVLKGIEVILDYGSNYNNESIQKSYTTDKNGIFVIGVEDVQEMERVVAAAEGKSWQRLRMRVDGKTHISVVAKGGYHYDIQLTSRYILSGTHRDIVWFNSLGMHRTDEVTQDDMAVDDIVFTEENVLREQSIALIPDHDIMVAGYGSARKSTVAGVFSDKEVVEQSAGAGVLVIVNGVPFSGGIDDLDQSMIEAIETLDAATAERLYGAKGANGVVVVTLIKGADQQDIQPGAMSLRRNFRDDAFWEPALTTDKSGRVKFQVTLPDDVTKWSNFFYANSGKGSYTAIKTGQINSFKALSAQLSTPRFAIEGDRIGAIGRLTNYLGVEQQLSVTAVTPQDSVTSNVVLNEGYSQVIEAVAPQLKGDEKDSLTLRYMVEKGGFFDGEERKIAIYPQGVMEAEGVFEILSGEAKREYELEGNGEITIYAETSSLEQFIREIDKVMVYPYMCNEQIGSKVKAMIMKLRMSKIFDVEFSEIERVETQKLITKLVKNQNVDKLWGWWNRDVTVNWIARHVIEALVMAQQENFEVDIDRDVMTQRILADLRNIDIPSDKMAAYSVKRNYSSMLILLHEMGATVNFKELFKAVDEIKDEMVMDKVMTMRIRQIGGEEISVEELTKIANKTMLGGVYWGELPKFAPYFRHMPHVADVQTTLLAYKILKKAGDQEKTLNAIRSYFFEQKSGGSWRNIYESSRVMETIIFDMVGENEKYMEVTLSVNGEKVEKFPYKKRFGATEKISLVKKGTAPLFFTAYQREWNREPEVVNKGFEVSSVFKMGEDTVAMLKEGEVAQLMVKMVIDADAEFIQIEVPIPAGCTYEQADVHIRTYDYVSGGRVYNIYRNEHRELYRDRVSIFVNSLPKGEHTFVVNLLPRFTGEYHVNPAKAELMYFPTFYGHEQMKKMEIKPYERE